MLGDSDHFLFADEAGNFDFSAKKGASKYFIIASVSTDDASAIGTGMMDLRRALVDAGANLHSPFHATEDDHHIREAVFEFIEGCDIRVDATIFEKRKAQPRVQTMEYFYKLACFNHFKHVAPRVFRNSTRAQVVAASLGTKKKRKAIREAVRDVFEQTMPQTTNWKFASWPADSDPCLQVADYCTWAVQRSWEQGDNRARKLIDDKIATEHDYFERGSRYYY